MNLLFQTGFSDIFSSFQFVYYEVLSSFTGFLLLFSYFFIQIGFQLVRLSLVSFVIWLTGFYLVFFTGFTGIFLCSTLSATSPTELG